MPVKLVRLLYRHRFGHAPNLSTPQNFNEKVLWLSLFSDTSRWTQLADKYSVRNYLRQCGGEDLLNELYAVWQYPEQIDLTDPRLPDSFVLKTNNGCGDIYIVHDKKTANIKAIRRHFKKMLNHHHGRKTGEYHYLRITPCIFAERLLDANKQGVAAGRWLIDYKFYCFNGEPRYCMICYDRGRNRKEVKTALYDAETWEDLTSCIIGKYRDTSKRNFEPPVSRPRMIEAARRLSAGFPEVRVDFYEIEGRPIFGEMTFTPAAGMDTGFSKDFINVMGDLVVLPEAV